MKQSNFNEDKPKTEKRVIRWSKGGKKVEVCGLFPDKLWGDMMCEGWIPLNWLVTQNWCIHLNLTPGIYIYQFYVDGQVMVDESKDIIRSNSCATPFNVMCVGGQFSYKMAQDLYNTLDLLVERDCYEEMLNFLNQFYFNINTKFFWITGIGTLLHWGCLHQRERVVSLLISKNSNVDEKFIRKGKYHEYTALQIAISNKNPTIQAILERAKVECLKPIHSVELTLQNSPTTQMERVPNSNTNAQKEQSRQKKDKGKDKEQEQDQEQEQHQELELEQKQIQNIEQEQEQGQGQKEQQQQQQEQQQQKQHQEQQQQHQYQHQEQHQQQEQQHQYQHQDQYQQQEQQQHQHHQHQEQQQHQEQHQQQEQQQHQPHQEQHQQQEQQQQQHQPHQEQHQQEEQQHQHHEQQKQNIQ